MKQREAVIEVMKANGGYATFGKLYVEALKIPNVKWGTKTPFASIRRIVQNDRYFFKIKPGLWALNESKKKLPFVEALQAGAPKNIKEEFNHSYYQGLLVEIGNLRGYKTAVPVQDKSKKFLGIKLSDIATVNIFYNFTYDEIVNKAKSVDVVWFNERKLPNAMFEVEHTTDIQRSLSKYSELLDFNIEFKIVADKVRKREYENKLNLEIFRPLRALKSVRFIDYDAVSAMHSKLIELKQIENLW